MPRRLTTEPPTAVSPQTTTAERVTRRRVGRTSASVDRAGDSLLNNDPVPPVAVMRRKAPVRRISAALPLVSDREPLVQTTPSRHRSGWVLATIVVLAVSASVALGVSDNGTINVDQKLQQYAHTSRVAPDSPSAGDRAYTIPVQSTSVALPNGGLQGRGIDSTPTPLAPAQEVASSSATSTDATASSTATTATMASTTEASTSTTPSI